MCSKGYSVSIGQARREQASPSVRWGYSRNHHRRLGILREETLAYAGSRSLGTLREMAEIFSDVARGRAQSVRFSDKQKSAAGGDRFDPRRWRFNAKEDKPAKN